MEYQNNAYADKLKQTANLIKKEIKSNTKDSQESDSNEGGN